MLFEDENFQVLTWTQLSQKDFPQQQWWVQGLVPVNGITLLAGVSGEKKSWLAMHLAFCIATGSHFLGSEKFPTTQGRVMYVDAEMDYSQLRHRGLKLKFSLIEEGELLMISEQQINLREEYNFIEFEAILESYGVRVVVIDTLRGVAGGLVEDKAEEVRRFMEQFKMLKHKGYSAIILDHCRKPLRNEGYAPKKEQILGSQDKVANAESVLMVKSEAGSQTLAVYQVKNRSSIEVKPFLVVMADNADGSIEFKYEGEYDEQISKLDEAKLAIPQIISTGSLTTKKIIEIMHSQYKVSERYVREALRALESSQVLVVEKVGREKSYKLSSESALLLV